jgi:hypothetical protein
VLLLSESEGKEEKEEICEKSKAVRARKHVRLNVARAQAAPTWILPRAMYCTVVVRQCFTCYKLPDFQITPRPRVKLNFTWYVHDSDTMQPFIIYYILQDSVSPRLSSSALGCRTALPL